MLDQLLDHPELKKVYDALQAKFPATILSARFEKGDLTVCVQFEALLEIIRLLYTEHKFNALNDIIGLDNLNSAAPATARFSILYLLYRFPGYERVRIQIDLDELAAPESLTSIYQAANWAEREIFDMFGIKFNNHPELKRIYMPDDFEDFPLRKDFPLEGRNGIQRN